MIVLFRAALALVLTLLVLFVFGCRNTSPPDAGISYVGQEGGEMSGKVISVNYFYRQL